MSPSRTRHAALAAVAAAAVGVSCATVPGRKVCLDLQASEDLNLYDGQPHALVVRLYPLSSRESFERLTPDELLDGTKPESQLGNPYETTIVPGEKKAIRERFPENARFIGILADYYRAPGDRSGSRTMSVRGGCGWFSLQRVVLGPSDLAKN